MSRSLLADAFEHHAWATQCLIDHCLGLDDAQLDAPIPGAYGPIRDTLRHIVGADAWELWFISDEPAYHIDADSMSLPELRVAAERVAAGWAQLLATNPDPDRVVHEVDPDDGYQRDAPLGLRLAGALDHASDHRSQICTALTALGMAPPAIDAMDFGLHTGRVTEVWPPA
jgi:uncharacterized damage-inducible protein DinB